MKYVRVDDGEMTAFINLENVASVEFEDGNCTIYLTKLRSLYLTGDQAAKVFAYMRQCSLDVRPDVGNIRDGEGLPYTPLFGPQKWGAS